RRGPPPPLPPGAAAPDASTAPGDPAAPPPPTAEATAPPEAATAHEATPHGPGGNVRAGRAQGVVQAALPALQTQRLPREHPDDDGEEHEEAHDGHVRLIVAPRSPARLALAHPLVHRARRRLDPGGVAAFAKARRDDVADDP